MNSETTPKESTSATPPDTAALSSALSALLAKPELTERLRGLPGGEAPSATDSATEHEAAPASAVLPPADGMVTLLSDPELMAKLPQMLSALRPLLSAPVTAPQKTGEKPPEVCRNELLLALKPFLSTQKREAVDALLRIAKLGEVLHRLK